MQTAKGLAAFTSGRAPLPRGGNATYDAWWMAERMCRAPWSSAALRGRQLKAPDAPAPRVRVREPRKPQV